jgi:hypothetical protein
MTEFAEAWSKYLPENHRKALHTALCVISDQFFDYDLESEENIFRELLPRQYLSFYTPLFLKCFFATFLTVGYKLALPKKFDTLIACTAEELALHILISEATAILETWGYEADFDIFEDAIYQDWDFEFLYDSENNLNRSSELQDELDCANLHPSKWFKPFLNASMPVHPYCQDEALNKPPNEK